MFVISILSESKDILNRDLLWFGSSERVLAKMTFGGGRGGVEVVFMVNNHA